ncbi:MAG: ABC transporter ATP-binding protein [Palaeococcus sp.]|uniref:ABC transporter ATP-binding protein n=1 Tax=Palaeococcus sp. (in: euryarchaeotes) TaxID=2820298 RepID=UPI000F193A90|nr:ABC transporter ATP-binding protein [Palaeococcus sp. (in: euryarchaeotes)]MCD6558898.1 ABC transporter ATP-binding protein [Palaeococcus sp. (in: euryarchaeotes)]RLF77591.1 MAG: ABC transporter ATP-binding protein [Thermococci archaeon]
MRELSVMVSFSYGEKKVLENVSFSAKKGELLSIIGPNGAGKSTLLKCMVGILKPKGRIEFDSINLMDLKPKDRAKFITYVPQSSVSEFAFTIQEFVEMGAYTTRGDVERALRKVNLWNRRRELVTNLSGGEYQLALIARALAQGSEIILLDEPTSNLDINHSLKIMEILSELKGEKLIIAVMHDLNLALRYSDRLILLSKGRIEWEGSSNELKPEILEKVYHVKAKIVEIEGNSLVLADI